MYPDKIQMFADEIYKAIKQLQQKYELDRFDVLVGLNLVIRQYLKAKLKVIPDV